MDTDNATISYYLVIPTRTPTPYPPNLAHISHAAKLKVMSKFIATDLCPSTMYRSRGEQSQVCAGHGRNLIGFWGLNTVVPVYYYHLQGPTLSLTISPTHRLLVQSSLTRNNRNITGTGQRSTLMAYTQLFTFKPNVENAFKNFSCNPKFKNITRVISPYVMGNAYIF